VNLLLVSPLTSKSLLGADFYFRMPTLGLLRVAAATPSDWKVAILDDKVEPIDFSRPADLVGITHTKSPMRFVPVACGSSWGASTSA
jgi:hypothetical protein